MKIKNKFSARMVWAFCAGTLVLTNCKKEAIEPEPLVNASQLTATDSIGTLSVASSSISSTAYRIERALPSGYVKDGSRDYTSYLQAAINKYSEIAFPGFPILVNTTGLRIPSNRKIYFITGSELRMKPTSASNYNIIRIENASNITLVDPVVRGDRAKHLGTSGEWGHGIVIKGGTNITVKGAKAYDCWGDGIYLGKGSSINKYITIENAYCRNNRRDGISVINADGLKLINPYTGYSNGTSPFCGINLEPETYTDELKNITISNPRTEKCLGNGIQVGLGNLYGRSSKTVSISIINHTDVGSGRSVKTSCYTTKRAGSETITGTLLLKDGKWQRNTEAPLKTNSGEKNYKVSISNPSIMNTSGSILSDATAKTLLLNECISRSTTYTLSF